MAANPEIVPNPELEALKRVISLCDDSRAELIRRLRAQGYKCSDSLVYVWENRDLKVSPDFVIPVSKAVGWQVLPHDLRRSLYPHPADGLPDHLRNKAAA